MAENSLTPEQDVLTRAFWQKVANDPDIFPTEQVSARRLRRLILDLLNYDVLPNGAFIQRGSKVQVKLGDTTYSNYPCQWERDTRRAMTLTAINETQEMINIVEDEDVEATDQDQDTDQASPSGETESS